jgi:hypothetical protein
MHTGRTPIGKTKGGPSWMRALHPPMLNKDGLAIMDATTLMIGEGDGTYKTPNKWVILAAPVQAHI